MTVSEGPTSSARSGLAELIELVATRWPGTDESEFFNWLERTAPIGVDRFSDDWDAAQALDALDAVILAAEADSSDARSKTSCAISGAKALLGMPASKKASWKKYSSGAVRPSRLASTQMLDCVDAIT